MFDCCTSDVLTKALMEQLPTTAWCKLLKRRIMQPEIGEAILFPKGDDMKILLFLSNR